MKLAQKCFVSCTLSMILLFSNVMPTFASNYANKMAPYEQKLNEINKELGTDYEFAYSDGDIPEKEIINFYTSMSIDEFDAFIRDAINEDNILSQKMETQEYEYVYNLNPNPYGMKYDQKYYYDGLHYVGLQTTYDVRNFITVYTSADRWYDSGSLGKYPYFSPYYCNTGLRNNNRSIYCVYDCQRFIAAGVKQPATVQIKVTFNVGEGDLYPGPLR